MWGKESFLLYKDIIHTVKKLTKEQRGDLFLTILEYVNDMNPKPSDIIIDIVFEPIKQQLKRDLKKWEGIKKSRSESGREGGIASGKARKQKKANEASASITKQSEANEAVSVIVSDSVSDIKNLNGEFTNSPPVTFEDKYRAFIKLFNDIKKKETGRKGKFRGDSKSKAQFKILLKQYTGKEITIGILAMFRDTHHIETEFRYATPDLLTRTSKFSRFYENG